MNGWISLLSLDSQPSAELLSDNVLCDILHAFRDDSNVDIDTFTCLYQTLGKIVENSANADFSRSFFDVCGNVYSKTDVSESLYNYLLRKCQMQTETVQLFSSVLLKVK